MTQNGEHKPTVNGVIKGRPGKGKVLSLQQRKSCYHGHKMTPDNTFLYTAKATKSHPKPLERAWCKRCRADSRRHSQVRRLEAALVEAKRIKAELAKAMPESSGKGKVKALANVARKGRNASAADLDAVLGKATAAKPKTIDARAEARKVAYVKRKAARIARAAAKPNDKVKALVIAHKPAKRARKAA